jgi:AraC family transcriptional regulator of arabinose operon
MRSIHPYWKNYLYRSQYELTTGGYGKLPTSWGDHHFTPEYNRFYFILDGEGMLEIAGKQLFPQVNQLYLLPADVEQSYSTISEHTFLKYWVHFNARIGGVNLFKLIELPLAIDVENRDFVSARFQAMLDALQSSDWSSVFKAQSLLLELISYFIEHAHHDHIRLNISPSMEKIDSLLIYIEQHLNTTFTIDQFVEISHYHPNHLIRVFKQFTGSSPIQYVNQRKIEHAKRLLASTNQSIAMIAEQFAMEPHYFTRVFKEVTQYSPSEYRKNITNQT